MPSYPAYLALGAALLLGACANDVAVRGNFVDPEVSATIAPGNQSRQQVADLLGSPSTLSNFEDSTWYYVGQKVEQQAFFAPEVVERSIFVVTFDGAGTVASTANYTLEDGRIIDPVTRKTPTEGRELTLLQQLFGNLGKFSGEGVTNPGRPTGT